MEENLDVRDVTEAYEFEDKQYEYEWWFRYV